MKTKIIPFDLKTAKKIQAGEIEGKIKTRNLKYECTIVEPCVYTGYTVTEKLLLIKFPAHDFEKEKLKVYHYDGRYMDKNYGENWFDLVLEVPDEQQFKPFDKVLVKSSDNTEWCAAIYSHYSLTDTFHYIASGCHWKHCIPYAGNEHLVGTTNKPNKLC